MNNNWHRWLRNCAKAASGLTKYQWQQAIRSASYVMFTITLVILQACAPVQVEAPEKSSGPLGFDFLQGSEPLSSPVSTHFFLPPGKLATSSNNFEGVLTLDPDKASSQLEVLTDTFNIIPNESLKIEELPPFSIRFVTDGNDLIPLRRNPQRSEHPYWEIIAEPGKTWDDPGDHGWSRASLPFTLKEKNENCTHNGLMTFLYRSDGSTSRVAWQVSSETCLYVKLNLWGTLDAEYAPRSIPSSGEVISAHRNEVANRLPVKPFSSLALDHPGLEQLAFEPPGVDDVTVYGYIVNGVHYRSDCPTRYGPYPFCDVLDLPSYSLAKSLVASIAYQLLVTRWPEFATIPVSELIPECKTADKRWDDVLPIHLLDMTTGNYDSMIINVDEESAAMQTFFLARSHSGKVQFSCNAWPRKSSPGTQWAYHTTDTYLLGVAMNSFLKRKLGSQADIYLDLLYPQVFNPLELSPALQWTQRTYDERYQPFSGYGLIFHADDIARLAQALNSDQSTTQYLDSVDFEGSVLPANSPANTLYDAKGLSYSRGFWGVDASRWMNCKDITWIPFMSGYGGIVVAMFPDGSVYYYFTDSNQHGFRNAAVEANKAINYCKES